MKTSLYWAMKNCGGDVKYLRQLIMNISKHYQVCFYTQLQPQAPPSIIKNWEEPGDKAIFTCMQHCKYSLTFVQGKQEFCHPSSFCKQPDYMPSKQLLTDPLAIDALEKTLQEINIYQYSESYYRVVGFKQRHHSHVSRQHRQKIYCDKLYTIMALGKLPVGTWKVTMYSSYYIQHPTRF